MPLTEKFNEAAENQPIENSELSAAESDVNDRVDSTGGEDDAGTDGFDDGDVDLRSYSFSETRHTETTYTSTTEYEYSEKLDTASNDFQEQFSEAAQPPVTENLESTETGGENQDAPEPTPPELNF